MIAKKTIFIIPGYKHKPNQKAYKKISEYFEVAGYTTVPILLTWNKKTIVENTEYFLKEYKKIRRKKKYVLGFSFGAMIAFLAATKVKVDGLILCSLSPYFTEDRPSSSLHFATLSKQIKAEQILMLYGGREARSLIRRVRQAYQQVLVPEKYLFPIKQTDHNIGDKKYLQTIHRVVKELDGK